MTEADDLRAQAKRCLRLAEQSHAGDVKQTLTRLAAEYLARARALDRDPVQHQQRDRPSQHQPSQQQQQIQPEKEEE